MSQFNYTNLMFVDPGHHSVMMCNSTTPIWCLLIPEWSVVSWCASLTTVASCCMLGSVMRPSSSSLNALLPWLRQQTRPQFSWLQYLGYNAAVSLPEKIVWCGWGWSIEINFGLLLFMSQGNLATRLRSDGIFDDQLITYLLLNLLVKEVLKLVNICWKLWMRV